MMGVFAEFERAMIVERVKAGLSRARSQGKRLGRPSLAADKEDAVRRLLSGGTGIVKTARLCRRRGGAQCNGSRARRWGKAEARYNSRVLGK